MIDRCEYRVGALGDFVNVHGKLVALYGCPFDKSEEFAWRCEKLRSMLHEQPAESDVSFESLLSDSVFRQNVERCLELHGLALSDVSLRHIQDLLLYEVVTNEAGEAELAPGLLIRINLPRTASEAADDTTRKLGGDPKQASRERALAVIASHTKSVSEAIELTRRMSVTQLSDYLEQSAELQKEIAELSDKAAGKAPSMSSLSKDQDLLALLDKHGD